MSVNNLEKDMKKRLKEASLGRFQNSVEKLWKEFLNQIRLKDFQNLVDIVFSMDVQVDGLG